MVLMIDFSIKMDYGVKFDLRTIHIYIYIYIVYCVGSGAYFADDPRKSHNYTAADEANTRVMFYNKVLLGDEAILTDIDKSLIAAPREYHSVRGTGRQYTEYIIYRHGQVLPYLKIIYRASFNTKWIDPF